MAYKSPRDLFEYWGHEASLLPVATQPLLRWRMEQAHEGAGLGRFARVRGRPRPDSAIRDRLLIWFPNGPNGLLEGAAQVSGGLRPRTAALAMAAPTPSTPWLVTRDEAWAQETTELLKALAEPTRLSMVSALWAAAAPVCICDFTTAFELSQPTISHHMARLKAAGLVESAKQGIWIYYRLRDDLAPGTRAVLETLLGPAPA